MKKVLITGGAGFLGSHMVKKVLDQGFRVFVIDNLQTGSLTKLQEFFPSGRLKFFEADITQPIELDTSIDWIFHMACPASPPHYQKDPIKTLKTSFLGTLHVLELARQKKARVLFSSTSEVYGDPLQHPQKETYWGNVNPHGVRACYDEGKRAAECLCMDYLRQHHVDVRIARIFNTYGPKMDVKDGRVVSNFIVQALQGDDITIYGDGNQTRSFCYVDDLIEGLWRFILAEESYPGPINLGNEDEFRIIELANFVKEELESSSKIVFRPLPKDDPLQRRPNTERALKKLNWKATTPLAKGLVPTLEYFRQALQKG